MHRVALGFKVYDRSRLPDFLYLISSIKNNFVAALVQKAEGTEVYTRGFNCTPDRKSKIVGVTVALKACPCDHTDKRIVKWRTPEESLVL